MAQNKQRFIGDITVLPSDALDWNCISIYFFLDGNQAKLPARCESACCDAGVDGWWRTEEGHQPIRPPQCGWSTAAALTLTLFRC